MTRAALLHVLAHTTALGTAEVRELEQLAQAFPYCQTAHLLLAKAAHDQGAMLASQRLRRAATYAADRALLRRLIEATPAPETALLSEDLAAAPPPPAAAAPPAAPEIAVSQPTRFVAPRPAPASETETPVPNAAQVAVVEPAAGEAADEQQSLPTNADARLNNARLNQVANDGPAVPALPEPTADNEAAVPVAIGQIAGNEPAAPVAPGQVADAELPAATATASAAAVAPVPEAGTLQPAPTAPVSDALAVPTELPTSVAPSASGVLAAVAGSGWAVSSTAQTTGAGSLLSGVGNGPVGEVASAAASARGLLPPVQAVALPALGSAASGDAHAETDAASVATAAPAAAVAADAASATTTGVAAVPAVAALDAAAGNTATADAAAADAAPAATLPDSTPLALPAAAGSPAAALGTAFTTTEAEAPTPAPKVAAGPALALLAAPAAVPTATPETAAYVAPAPAEAPEAPTEAPAVAPPVRPPAGAARFEYGLAEELDPTPAYLLPGLSDEWTWTLPPKPFVQPALTPAAFLGDAAVGYGWGESSRLGLALMPLLADDQPAGPAPTAFALPRPNDFFAPDALLQQHWADHRPQAPPPPTSLELIETFLRQKPRLTRPALAKTSSEAIADLAAPSTNAPPELVSESLARILARQGKLARAIEVYERLMVKHPEKMAYFATEIQSLQLQQPPLP